MTTHPVSSAQDIRKFQSYAERTLKNHTYTKIVDQGGYAIWRCQNPEDSEHNFDIVVNTNFTGIDMQVVGHHLIWSFSSFSLYPLEILAATDIEAKLDNGLRCDKTKYLFNPNFLWVMGSFVLQDLAKIDGLSEELKQEISQLAQGFKADIDGYVKVSAFLGRLVNKLQVKAVDNWQASPSLLAPEITRLCDMKAVLDELSKAGTIEAVTKILGKQHVFELDPEDLAVARPSPDFLRQLYLLNHAAKMIVEQKKTAIEPRSTRAVPPRLADEEQFEN